MSDTTDILGSLTTELDNSDMVSAEEKAKWKKNRPKDQKKEDMKLVNLISLKKKELEDRAETVRKDLLRVEGENKELK